jgi:signal transduction histidine kinase
MDEHAQRRPVPPDTRRDIGDLFGASDMARLIIERDWADTPLGPIEQWPDALVGAVATILRSSFQLAIYWGPELILLYNDAERLPLGDLHPGALGQSARITLRDIWPEVGPMLEGVLATGEPTWAEDAPLVFRRGAAPEEAFFTWSYSPVLGRSGRPEGVFLVSTETTRHVLAERRLRTLSTLAERTGGLQSVDEVWRRSVAALTTDPDILCAEIYVVERDEPSPLAVATGRSVEAPRPEAFHVHDVVTVARSGMPILRDAGQATSTALFPLVGGYPLAASFVMALAVSGVRLLDRGQRDYLQLAATQAATAASNAAAYEHQGTRSAKRGAVEERRRIERDLHDSIQRQLLGARLVTELTRDLGMHDPAAVDQRLEELSNHLGTALSELREVIEGSYPSLLSTGGLPQAVRVAAERANLAVRIDAAEIGRFDETTERAVYFATLEALQNAFKHGGGADVSVHFRVRRERLTVFVHDAGAGFDHAQTSDGGGFRNMRERMESVGGCCRRRSSPGHGTWVHLSCPATRIADGQPPSIVARGA